MIQAKHMGLNKPMLVKMKVGAVASVVKELNSEHLKINWRGEWVRLFSGLNDHIQK